MNLKRIALLALVGVATGAVGYYAGVMRENGAMRLSRSAALGPDYLAVAESFSEVENARAALEGLAATYADRAQALIAEDIILHSTGSAGELPGPERSLRTAIALLDEVLPDFRGTGAEPRLLRPLLYALKQEGLHGRWLDVYLDTLYRHPTDQVVADLAGDAATISQALGRQTEFSAALRHLSEIPLSSFDQTPLDLSLNRSGYVPLASNHACRD